MPSNTNIPLVGGRKTVTDSARARLSNRKICKSVNGNTHGSYFEEPEQTVVSSIPATEPVSSVPLGEDSATVTTCHCHSKCHIQQSHTPLNNTNNQLIWYTVGFTNKYCEMMFILILIKMLIHK